jgi:hypothetical protein
MSSTGGRLRLTHERADVIRQSKRSSSVPTIIPKALGRMLTDKDAAKSARVMNAMLQMIKLDLAELQKAYDGA